MLGFGKIRDALGGAVKKFSGRKDFLEAVCAATALVASADGEVSDAEVSATTKLIAANPTLAGSFKTSEIEKTADAMLKRAQSGRSGRAGLYREIDDIRGDSTMAETVYLCAVDLAEADGKVEPREKDTLRQIADRLGVNPAVANV
jgi:tellurite resistance protein TerB